MPSRATSTSRPTACSSWQRHFLVDQVVLGQQQAVAAVQSGQALLGAACRRHAGWRVGLCFRPGTDVRPPTGAARGVALRQHVAQLGREPEPAADAGRAVDADLAAHQLRQTPRDRQAQAGAAEAARGRAVGLLEGREQAGDLVGRDADAGVRDLEAQRADPAPRGASSRTRSRTWPRSVNLTALDSRFSSACDSRVGSPRSAPAGRRRRPRGPGPSRARARPPVPATRSSIACSVEVGLLQRQLAGLDLGQVEDVVDELQQVARGVADLASGARAAAAPRCRAAAGASGR